MLSPTTEKKYTEMCNQYGHLQQQFPDTQITNLRKQGLSTGSIRNILCAFKWQSGDNKYDTYIHELNSQQRKEKPLHTNRFKKIDWSTLTEPTNHTINDVIKGLYIYFPPRRIEDYAYMQYITSDTNIGENNYYNSTSNEFIFKKYKTYHRYGEQRFSVPPKLVNLLTSYIETEQLPSGATLLQYNGKSGKFSERTLRNKLQKIFGVSVDGLRHSYITYLYKTPENLYNIEDISNKMAHSVGIHITYLDKDNQKNEN